MATITENIDRIKQAKSDIKEAIIAKGVEVADDAKIDEYAEKIGEIKQGGGSSQYAIDYGEEIATNNEYSFNADREDVDYYNQIQAERAAYAAGQGGRSDAEILADPEFKAKIAWWPQGMAHPTTYNYHTKLQEINGVKFSSNTSFAGCAHLRKVSADMTAMVTTGQKFSNLSSLEHIDMTSASNFKDAYNLFGSCVNLKSIHWGYCDKVSDFGSCFYNCFNLREIILGEVATGSFYDAFRGCINLAKVIIPIKSGVAFNLSKSAFQNCKKLTCLKISNWQKGNIVLTECTSLSVESIAYIIANAGTLDNGAELRTITLYSSVGQSWAAITATEDVYTAEDGTQIPYSSFPSMASDKGITITY